MFKKLTATLLLVSTNALAGLPPTTIKAQNGTKSGFFNLQTPAKQVTKVDGTTALIETGNDNLVENPGFEASSISTGWTASGGSLSKTTTSGQFRQETGKAAASWDSSAASQTLSGTAFTVSSNMNAEVNVWIKVSSGTATHKLQVTDGTNVVAEVSITQDTNGFAKTSLNFAAIAGTSYTPRLISVASNEPAIYVDDFYGGTATNVGNGAQATISWSGYHDYDCDFSRASASSFADYNTDATCTFTTQRNVSFPTVSSTTSSGNKLPGIEFTPTRTGTYRVCAMYSSYDSGSNSHFTKMIESTSSAELYNNMVVSNGQNLGYSQSNVSACGQLAVTSLTLQTIKLQGKSGGSSTIAIPGAASGSHVINWTVELITQDVQTAYRPDLQALSWSGYHDVNCSWTVSSSSFSDYGDDASCTLTEVTNRNFGTVTSYGSSKPGLTFTPKKTGFYEVCAFYAPQVNSGRVGSFALTTSGGVEVAEVDTVGNGSWVNASLCGIFNVADLSSQSVRLRTKVDNATASNLGNVGGTGNRSVWWTIKALDQNIPAPVLVGSNSTVQLDSANGNGSTNTAIQRFTNVNLNQGSAITYADSATLGASFTINMAGMYCAQWSSSKGSGTSNVGFSVNSSTLTTSIGAMSYAQGKRHFTSVVSSSGQAHASWCGYLNAGDVLRPHNDGGTYDTSNSTVFSISKVD